MNIKHQFWEDKVSPSRLLPGVGFVSELTFYQSWNLNGPTLRKVSKDIICQCSQCKHSRHFTQQRGQMVEQPKSICFPYRILPYVPYVLHVFRGDLLDGEKLQRKSQFQARPQICVSIKQIQISHTCLL